MLQLSIEAAAKAVSDLAVAHSPITSASTSSLAMNKKNTKKEVTTTTTTPQQMMMIQQLDFSSLSMPSFFGTNTATITSDKQQEEEDRLFMRRMCAHLLVPKDPLQPWLVSSSSKDDENEDDGYTTFRHVGEKRLERVCRLYHLEAQRSSLDRPNCHSASSSSSSSWKDDADQFRHVQTEFDTTVVHDSGDDESSSSGRRNDSIICSSSHNKGDSAVFHQDCTTTNGKNDDDIISCSSASSSSSSSTRDDDSDARSASGGRLVSYVRGADSVFGPATATATATCNDDMIGSGVSASSSSLVFQLPIICTAGKTGFEESSDLALYPGMLVAERYLVQQVLGSAAFSTAYRCMDLKAGSNRDDDGDNQAKECEVCLKVIRNKKDYFDQSLDEIKILQYLKDSNRCEENNVYVLLDYFYYKEHLIIVTELLSQNLYEFGKFIRENDEPSFFTLKRLNFIARQILVALDFVHEMGILHTDLKPENILISSYSRATVKLIDFGSSCYKTDKPSYYIQSRSYRAPEVVLGLPYDEKIDIWSLGCVIAEMFTGYVTFQNDSLASMLSRIESICGNFPRHMTKDGKYSKKLFLECGLLFEKEDEEKVSNHEKEGDDDNCDETYFTVYQPKSTTLAERLGFDPDHTSKEQTLFIHFVKSLLTTDPELRPTAREALEHPWIVMGRRYGLEELEYP